MVHSQKYLTKAKKDDISRTNVAAIVVNSRQEVLLCRRNIAKKVAPGAWHMPGGKVEEGETMEQATSRELAEELAITVTKTGGILEAFHDYSVASEKHRTYFMVVQATGRVRLNLENDAVKFVPVDKIGDYLEPDRVELNIQAAVFGAKQALYSDVTL